jgi:Flp pilus assembly pilin Flp
MIKKVKRFIGDLNKDQNGSYMVEAALVMVGVALTVYAAAAGLSNNAIVPKYNGISTQIQSLPVPDLTP